MGRIESIKSFAAYLKLHNIKHKPTFNDGCVCYMMNYIVDSAPSGYVESCIWFRHDYAETRTYYSSAGASICKNSPYYNRLLQLLNYINYRVFLSCGDPYGLYFPHQLYTPRIYCTVDGCFDITITTIINYDFWEIAPLETQDYITIYCPELLDKLACPIFHILEGKYDVEQAIDHIENMI